MTDTEMAKEIIEEINILKNMVYTQEKKINAMMELIIETAKEVIKEHGIDLHFTDITEYKAIH